MKVVPSVYGFSPAVPNTSENLTTSYTNLRLHLERATNSSVHLTIPSCMRLEILQAIGEEFSVRRLRVEKVIPG